MSAVFLSIPATDLAFTPDENHQVADMANVGHQLLQEIAAYRPDYRPLNSPAEIVGDLVENIANLQATIEAHLAAVGAPIAWVSLTATGNCRIWFGNKASADAWAERNGMPALTPLYLSTLPSAQPAAPICTCPSGDGSLQWPCPTHPPTSPQPAQISCERTGPEND